MKIETLREILKGTNAEILEADGPVVMAYRDRFEFYQGGQGEGCINEEEIVFLLLYNIKLPRTDDEIRELYGESKIVAMPVESDDRRVVRMCEWEKVTSCASPSIDHRS